MIRVFKYRLITNDVQKTQLNYVLEMCCFVYNAALSHRINAYKAGVKVTVFDQQTELSAGRNCCDDFQKVSYEILSRSLHRLDKAYKFFFYRCLTNNKKKGFPRFKSKQQYKSFEFIRAITDDTIKVPLCGRYRFIKSRDFIGKVKLCRINRDHCGDFWLDVVCDIGEKPAKIKLEKRVGIDVGLKTYATLTDNTVIDNPRKYKASLKRLQELSRNLSKKEKNSNNRRKARFKLAKKHRQVARQRQDFLHKESTKIVKSYDLIAVEKLDVQEMFEQKLFSRSIADAAWAKFRYFLSYKAESAGKTFVEVDPKNTSKMCSSCGRIKRTLGLGERVYTCKCGFVLDRDLNAARNILKAGHVLVEKQQKCKRHYDNMSLSD